MKTFLSASESTKEIARMAVLARPLAVNVLIRGGAGSGKTTLAKEIAEDAPIARGENESEIAEIASRSRSFIIEDFDRVSRPDRLDLEGKRVVATTAKNIDQNIIDRYFGIAFSLPPLSERREDISLLSRVFLDEAKSALGIDAELDLGAIETDLRENARSLRRSVYKALLIKSFGEKEIMAAMESFLREKMRGGNGSNIYRDFLRLYDLPIIKAGMSEYKSRLKLADALGINRNTLRKKTNDLRIAIF